MVNGLPGYIGACSACLDCRCFVTELWSGVVGCHAGHSGGHSLPFCPSNVADDFYGRLDEYGTLENLFSSFFILFISGRLHRY